VCVTKKSTKLRVENKKIEKYLIKNAKHFSGGGEGGGVIRPSVLHSNN